MAKMKILLVDDEEDFLTLIGARIKGWGYETCLAKNGLEALELLQQKKPDLLILDYLMPDTDGIALLRQIRQKRADIPVIMFTAHPDKEVLDAANELRVNAFIPKLSAYSEVHTALKTAIDIIEKSIKVKE